MVKHKFASISLTMRDRAISAKFSTHRVSKECNLYNFQKIFPSPKMAAILNFRIFAKNGISPKVIWALYFSPGGHFEFLPKMAKHKFASISLTARNFRPTGYLRNVIGGHFEF